MFTTHCLLYNPLAILLLLSDRGLFVASYQGCWRGQSPCTVSMVDVGTAMAQAWTLSAPRLALMHASDAHPALQNAALRLALSEELLPRLAVPPAEPVRDACTHALRYAIPGCKIFCKAVSRGPVSMMWWLTIVQG